MNIMKRTFKVKGMTCSSCEVILERSLRKVPGVEKVTVSRAKEEARVECADSVAVADLQTAVAEKGYALSLSDVTPEKSRHSFLDSFILRDKNRFSEIGSVIMILFAAYIVLNQFDLLPQNIGVSETMSYGFIFVIGLVAAASTCMAVAGGLLLAVATKYNERYPHLNKWQKLKPHLYFNGGRIVGYTLLGGAIGALGSVLTISPAVTGFLTIAAGVLMILMGLQMLHVFPWLTKIQVKMPKAIAHKMYDVGQNERLPKKSTSFLFGAATFFLPCGFTQALQLYVLGKGDFIIGALTMLAFSLGTSPGLLSVGAISSFSKGKFQRYFSTFSAVLIIILGVYNIPSGMTLTGASIAFFDDGADRNNVGGMNDIKLVDGKQIVEMAVTGLDYAPADFTLRQGVPVEWRIDGTKAQGCAQIISVPKLGIRESLPRDKIKVITFTPESAGTIKFSCGMGMAGPGTFTVKP
ncbi:sulfite exporter TauE/SafE family protein [Candidatus Woesearchaeota archaeon]|nr:sulfite exporter TauE/SafE family protein [Candidatus Woesearchaeota archaeon]